MRSERCGIPAAMPRGGGCWEDNRRITTSRSAMVAVDGVPH